MESDNLVKRIQEANLPVPWEAALRKMFHLPHDPSDLPQAELDEEQALLLGLLSIGSKYPQNVTGPCEGSVEVPTVVIDEVGSQHEGPPGQVISIQWFGRTTRTSLQPYQFRFLLAAGPGSIYWMGHPERFRVVFLGQIQDWPRPDAVDAIAKSVGSGSRHSYIAWLWSDLYLTQGHQGNVPASLACGLVLIGNPEVGAIYPETYCNTEPLEAFIQTLRQGG